MEVKGGRIAFIGTGVMGKSMAGHLVKAGASVTGSPEVSMCRTTRTMSPTEMRRRSRPSR